MTINNVIKIRQQIRLIFQAIFVSAFKKTCTILSQLLMQQFKAVSRSYFWPCLRAQEFDKGFFLPLNGKIIRQFFLLTLHLEWNLTWVSLQVFSKLFTWLSKKSSLMFIVLILKWVSQMYTPPFDIALNIIRLLKSSYTYVHVTRAGNWRTICQANAWWGNS